MLDEKHRPKQKVGNTSRKQTEERHDINIETSLKAKITV